MPTHKPQVLTLEDRSVPATLAGVVFADINGDSRQGVSEGGIAGATVQLDANSDNVVDQTTTSGPLGAYTFADVPAGTHTVTITPPAGTPSLGTVTSVVSVTGVDAANTKAIVELGLRSTGSVRGVVFTDLNGDGVRDASEPGQPGVLVGVDLLGDGSVEFNTTTRPDGSFEVANVPDGAAKVTVTPPANYFNSGPATSVVTVSAVTPTPPVALGVRPTTALSGRITSTLGSIPLAGVTVYLDRTATGAAQTVSTDANGQYVFANVPTGKHAITVDAPAGTTFTTPDGTGVLNPTVILPGPGSGGLTTGLDLAVRYTGGVVGSMFLDTNGNGTFEAGSETTVLPGVAQIDVNNSGTLVAVSPVALPDGSFRVDGIPDGTHSLVLTPPGAAAGTAPRRAAFTVANGAVATSTAINLLAPDPVAPLPTEPTEPNGPTNPNTPPAPLPGGPVVLGTGVAIGNADGPLVQQYTFTPNADGTLTATKGRTLNTAGVVGSRAVQADFNGDGVDDTITATGPGSSAYIRVYDGKTGEQVAAWDGFEAAFTGGVNLAAGDFNGDGKDDIVAAADVGGGPRVRVFNAAQFQAGADPAQGKMLADFFAIEDARFRGGSRVAVGDMNKDGYADLVVAAGVGGGPRIAIFDGRTVTQGQSPRKLVGDFFAFEQQLRNGATVSVGDVNGDGYADLVTGAGLGGAPRVVVFNGFDVASSKGAASARIADFYVNGDSTSRGGTVVAVKDLDGDSKADVVAGNGPKAYVFTSRSMVAQYLNPRPGGPANSAELDAFGAVRGISVG